MSSKALGWLLLVVSVAGIVGFAAVRGYLGDSAKAIVIGGPAQAGPKKTADPDDSQRTAGFNPADARNQVPAPNTGGGKKVVSKAATTSPEIIEDQAHIDRLYEQAGLGLSCDGVTIGSDGRVFWKGNELKSFKPLSRCNGHFEQRSDGYIYQIENPITNGRFREQKEP